MISRKYCRYRERMKTEQLHLLRDLFAVAGIFLVPDFDAVKVAHDGPHFLARSCWSRLRMVSCLPLTSHCEDR